MPTIDIESCFERRINGGRGLWIEARRANGLLGHKGRAGRRATRSDE